MLRQVLLLAVFFLLALLVAGCATPEPKNPMNDLWRQGYGFNNPNAERIRQGLPPKDF
jgi:outer membrane protein assembly factor BamE (lipoprotein component of BamABCDE complex)